MNKNGFLCHSIAPNHVIEYKTHSKVRECVHVFALLYDESYENGGRLIMVQKI